ncbi:hypothetical protein Mgra_00009555, partial [Meloidogyne graminicola]
FLSDYSIYGEEYGFLSEKALIGIVYYLLNKHQNAHYRILLKEFHLLFEKKKFMLKFEEKVEIKGKDRTKIKKFFEINFRNENKNQSNEWIILYSNLAENNVLKLLNKSTERIIKNQNNSGLKNLSELSEEIEKNASIEVLKQKWLSWLGNGQLFVEKYENLLLIICSNAKDSLYGPQFCYFVESNFREKLQNELVKLTEIEYVHIRPFKLLNLKECPKS